MKRAKKIVQLCFALLTVVTVVAVAKIDTKAAEVQITGIKQKSADTNSVIIEWNTNGLSSGYEIVSYQRQESNGTWGTVQTVQTTTTGSVGGYRIIGDLTSGSTYRVSVEIYGSYNAVNKVYSNRLAYTANPIEVVTKPGKYTSFAIKQTAATTTSATVAWNACPGANCYEVEYASSGASTTKTTYTTGTSIKLSSLTKNKSANVYVTPCRKASTGFVADSSNKKELSTVVVPSKPGIKYTSISKKELTIYAKDNSNYYVDGFEYDIYKVSGNKRIKLLKPSSYYSYCSYSNKAFAKNDLFKVKVRAYAKAADGKKYYTGWSSWNYFSTDKIIKSVKNKGSKGIEVKWNKINGASGYKVYVGTKNDSKKYKVVATIKKGSTTSTTFKKYNKKALKNGQRYYVYVKPYYKSGKKTYDVVNGYYTYGYLTYKK